MFHDASVSARNQSKWSAPRVFVYDKFSRYDQSSYLERTIPHKRCPLQCNNDTIRHNILHFVHLFCCNPFYSSVCVCQDVGGGGGGCNGSPKWTLF
jgi:hypothetical protein